MCFTGTFLPVELTQIKMPNNNVCVAASSSLRILRRLVVVPPCGGGARRGGAPCLSAYMTLKPRDSLTMTPSFMMASDPWTVSTRTHLAAAREPRVVPVKQLETPTKIINKERPEHLQLNSGSLISLSHKVARGGFHLSSE